MSDSFDDIRKMYIPIPTRFGTIFAWDCYPNRGYLISGDYGMNIPTNKPKLEYKLIPFEIKTSATKNGVGVYLFGKLDFVYPDIKPLSKNDFFSKTDLRKINKGLMEDFNNWVAENPQIIKEYAKRARQRDIDMEQNKFQYLQDEMTKSQEKIQKIQRDIDENYS